MNKTGKIDVKALKLLLVIIFLGMFFNPLIDFFANILWFKSIGYVTTFWKIIYSKIKIFTVITILISGAIYYYISVLNKNYKKYFNDDFVVISKYRNLKLFLGSLIVGIMFGYSFTNFMWKDVLLFLNAQAFNKTDPIFNMDIGFYVFKLPLIKSLLSIVIFILIWMTVLTALYFIKKKLLNLMNIEKN